MFSDSDKRSIRNELIAGLILWLLIGGGAVAIWSNIPLPFRPYIVTAIILWVLMFPVVFYIYRKLRPVVVKTWFKPKLVVSAKDISIYVSLRQMISSTTGQGYPVIHWWAECMLEVRNKRQVEATQVLREVVLRFGQENNEHAVLSAKRTTHTFALSKGDNDKLREHVVFAPQDCAIEAIRECFDSYPDGPFVIEYTYFCREWEGPQTVKVKGQLSKADWVRHGVVQHGDPIEIIRTNGFRRLT